jgi:hypothetical protein
MSLRSLSLLIFVLLGVLLGASGCTAGNFDVVPCAPPPPQNLGVDICNRINVDIHQCSLYQCDAVSNSCKLSPRDYDRDGDPAADCGGSDCNDFDPLVNGINQACGCKPEQLNQPCAVGIGYCQVKARYTCKTGTLYCADARPPLPGVDYMTQPDPASGSWDWDCSGSIESGCRDKQGAIGDCPPVNCNPALADSLSRKDYDGACSKFCSPFNVFSADCVSNTHTIVCDKSCGQPVVTCKCGFAFTGCVRSGAATVQYVQCK